MAKIPGKDQSKQRGIIVTTRDDPSYGINQGSHGKKRSKIWQDEQGQRSRQNRILLEDLCQCKIRQQRVKEMGATYSSTFDKRRNQIRDRYTRKENVHLRG